MRTLKNRTTPFRQRVGIQQPVCRGSSTSAQLKNESSASTRTSPRITRIKHGRHHRRRRQYEQLRACSPKHCAEPGPSKPQTERTPTNSTYDSALTLDPVAIPTQPNLAWLPSLWLKDTLVCSFPPGLLPPSLTAQLAPLHDPDCPICCAPLSILPPCYDDPAVRTRIDQGLEIVIPGVARHANCGRTVHRYCFAQWVHSCYYSSDKVTCPMCWGLLWQHERDEGVVRAAQMVGSRLGSHWRITGRWHWRVRGGWCVQCTMLQVLLTRVALLVVLRALYGVAGCACWMFGVKG